MNADEAKEGLKKFLELNPASNIQVDECADKNDISVSRPWGDDSLVLIIKEKDETLFQSLNEVYLPECFSALYHADTQSIEFIWTPHPSQSVAKRRFTFGFEGAQYECEFGPSSDRLITIAGAFKPIGPSYTDYRNLVPFLVRSRRREGNSEPFSFWVKGPVWNEDAVIRLAHHLNFYMSYYDVSTPRIVIHTQRSDTASAIRSNSRFIDGSFPDKIDGRGLDEHLLHFWDASLMGDPARRLIYCYRLIEYASFSYLDCNTRNVVRRILSSPNMAEHLSEAIEKVVATIQASKIDDIQRINACLNDTVDPSLLWKEISTNTDAFTSDTLFDGGFKIGPLVTKNCSEEHFRVNWAQNFHKSLRDIRNALSHGRDQKTALLITPTMKNFDLLRPWVGLASIAAGEVILYHGIV